jgi:hypothetical protein
VFFLKKGNEKNVMHNHLWIVNAILLFVGVLFIVYCGLELWWAWPVNSRMLQLDQIVCYLIASLYLLVAGMSFLSGIYKFTKSNLFAVGFLTFGLRLYCVLRNGNTRSETKHIFHVVAMVAIVCTLCFVVKATVIIYSGYEETEESAMSVEFNGTWYGIIFYYFGTETFPTGM